MNGDAEEYLSLDELVKIIPLAKGTVYRYTSKGLIPHIKVGRRLVFKRSDIDAWLERHRRAQ